MHNLNSLLERFAKILNKDSLIKEAIANTIKERARVILDPSQINLKEGVLEITAGPVAKNELRLKEDSIKEELRESRKIVITRILYK